MNTTHKIKAATATLTVGFLLAIAIAATAPTAYGREGMSAQQRQAVQGMTAQQQQQQAVRARAIATNRHYQLGIFPPGAGTVLRAEELRGQAMNRFYGLGSNGAAAQQAVERRNEAINRFYGVGAARSTGAVQQAMERRGQAMNRFYGVGNSSSVSTSSPFDWRDTGIGAGGLVGLIILAGGLTVLVRRHSTGTPSSPSTT